MKNILCILPEVGTGGLEKVMITLANNINKKRFKFTVMVLKPGFDKVLDELDSEIEVIKLNITGKLRYKMFTVIREINKVKPDILYSTSNGLNAQLAPWILYFRYFKKIKTVARVVILLSLRYKKKQYKLFSKLHNFYDSVIAQSIDMSDDLIQGGTLKNKITVINNPVDTEKIVKKSLDIEQDNFIDSDKYNLIAAGRLVYQKNFQELIKRVSENRDLNIHLTIMGTGDDYNELVELAESLKCEDMVTFAGYRKNPYFYMKEADLFVLSSRFEGFPNVILEALTCGLPVLANRCPGGINEIIEEGFNGYTCNVEEPESFRQSLIKCQNTQFDSNKITTKTKDLYGIKTIIKNYEKIFDSY